MMQNLLPKCPHAVHLSRDDASCSDWLCTCLQPCVFIRSPHHKSVNFCAGSLSRREAERICPGWRLEPGLCATPAARAEAAAGSGHPKHGIPLHQLGEHVCLQQRMLVPRYACSPPAAILSSCASLLPNARNYSASGCKASSLASAVVLVPSWSAVSPGCVY